MAEQERAKRPVSAAIAGPYGHPFHPMLVTVPIGSWVASLVFDFVSLGARSPDAWRQGATWLIGIGVVGALAAATLGFLDFLLIPPATRVRRVALTHMLLNLGVTAAFAVGFAWRMAADSGPTGWGPLVLSLVAITGLGVSGALGGELAYRYGVRVADEETQAGGFNPEQT